MRSWLSIIPLSARQNRRENRMTLGCIAIAVFLVTGVFSMAEMAARQELRRLVSKHGVAELVALLHSQTLRSLLPIAGVLFVLVLLAGVFMIAGSMSASVARRTRSFGMMRCIGMSRRQLMRYVRLEALNQCKTAVPLGVLAGVAATWILCAVLRYGVGGEWADMPQLGVSVLGILAGALVGVLTVLLAALRPARSAAKISPVTALSGGEKHTTKKTADCIDGLKVETAMGVQHAVQSRRRLALMVASFALSIVLFLSVSVLVELVDCLMPQSAAWAELSIAGADNSLDASLPGELSAMNGVKRSFGRRAVFDVPADCEQDMTLQSVDIISLSAFDLDALRQDGLLEKGCDWESVASGSAAFVISDRQYAKGDSVTVMGERIPIAGQLRYDPFSDSGSPEGHTTLILPDERFAALTGVTGYTLVYVQLTKDAADAEVAAIRARLDDGAAFSDEREYDNRSTYAAFLCCVYGFAAVVALVTALNVANSISLGVTARRKQYGVMRAVGMDGRQLVRMLAAEALTYVLLGCAVGTGLGLAFSRWLYGVLVTAHFAYAHWSVPWAELALVLGFCALSVLAGVSGSARRLRRMSVIENMT